MYRYLYDIYRYRTKIFIFCTIWTKETGNWSGRIQHIEGRTVLLHLLMSDQLLLETQLCYTLIVCTCRLRQLFPYNAHSNRKEKAGFASPDPAGISNFQHSIISRSESKSSSLQKKITITVHAMLWIGIVLMSIRIWISILMPIQIRIRIGIKKKPMPILWTKVKCSNFFTSLQLRDTVPIRIGRIKIGIP
jgi:hypothetical protein